MADFQFGTRDPRWPSYPNTVMEFENGSGPVSVDLRRPLSRRDHEKLAALRVPAPFGVITAANPVGLHLSDGENKSRHEALLARLESLGIRQRSAADGLSPDGSHRETGFAVHASRDVLRRLANEFEQSAFFWFDGNAFWLVDAKDDSHEVRLPPDEQ